MTTPAINLDALSQDDLENMDMAQLEALAQGGAQSPPVPEAPPQEMAQAPSPEAAAMATPEAPAPMPAPEAPPMPAQDTRPGDPEVPLRAMREQLREAKEREQQIEAFLNNPRAVADYLRSIAPEEVPSFDEDPDAAIEARMAPILRELQALKEKDRHREAQWAHNERMANLAGKYGQDFHHVLQAFDAANEHLANLDPEVRYHAALGLRARTAAAPDPAADEARIQAAAQKLLAEKLASGQPMRGIPTLGAAPQARESAPAPNLDAMSQDEQDRMSFADLQAMTRKAYGG